MEKSTELKALLQDKVFQEFYEISQIPRGSGNEQAISDFLVTWANERDLSVIQDKAGNVLIRKPASCGYEPYKTVLLQAHMDMVCEKIPESSHDFLKDPIPWVLDGDLLTTGGETTLGADDGIGMALAMAVLEEKEWKHPTLEVLFTVMEEEDLSGASTFDTKKLNASYLVNLDHVSDKEILCGSCGGEAVEILLPLEKKDIPDSWSIFELSITGLLGGHSGEDINKGRGSANEILARIWMSLEKEMPVGLCDLQGGSFRLAIPREAFCTIALPADCRERAEKSVLALEKLVQTEYQMAGENIKIQLLPSEKKYETMFDPEKLISLILFSPDGIWEMNADMNQMVNTSDNLGEMYLENGHAKVIYEIRSAHNSARDHVAVVLERLAKLLGGTCRMHSDYPSWIYQPQSPFREIAGEVFETVNGCRPEIYSVHAGLEVGCFFETKPELDAISIGPDCWGLHSPQERLSISSTKKVYRILKQLLEKTTVS